MVSLFNDISNFIAYLTSKPSLLKNSRVTIFPLVDRIKGYIIPFPSPKVKTIVQLEFELANNNVTVQLFKCSATRTPSQPPPNKSK